MRERDFNSLPLALMHNVVFLLLFLLQLLVSLVVVLLINSLAWRINSAWEAVPPHATRCQLHDYNNNNKNNNNKHMLHADDNNKTRYNN